MTPSISCSKLGYESELALKFDVSVLVSAKVEKKEFRQEVASNEKPLESPHRRCLSIIIVQ